MDDPNAAASANPFDQIGSEPIDPIVPSSAPAVQARVSALDPSPVPAPPAASGPDENPFDSAGPIDPNVSATGAFFHAAERGVVPAAGGMLGGAAAGALAGSFAGPLGTIGGGLFGAFGGSYALGAIQDYALSKLPEGLKEYFGQDEQTQEVEAKAHPYWAFAGGTAPFLLTARPGGFTAGATEDNASFLARMAAHPLTSHLFGGAMVGGTELAQEELSGEGISMPKLAIATSAGLIFDRPNAVGRAIEAAGARPAEALVHAAGIGALPPVIDRTVEPPMSILQAGDAKIVGPGINEDVFQGSQEQHPAAQAMAEDAARAESQAQGVTFAPDPYPVARQMEPELFDEWDALNARMDTFRSYIDQQNNPPDEALDALTQQRTALEDRLATIPVTGAGRNLPEARRVRAQIRDVQSQFQALQDRRDAFASGQGEDTLEASIARQHLLDTAASPSPGSIRTRRYRDRLKSGKIFVRFEMTPEGVERLVAQGWLNAEKRDDPAAVTSAFLALGVAVLWPEKKRA